jgi:predicted MFS family arabinose efflux permease
MHMLAVSIVQGGLFAFLMPARQTLIPQLVGQENLSNAISLDAAAMSATTLVAPAIGGGLYNVIGPDGVYYLIVSCSILAILFTAVVRVPQDTVERSKKAMFADIGQGLGYVTRSPLVLVLLVIGLITAVLAMPFRFLLPVFVVDVYGRGPEALGLLVTIMGLGSLIGSLLVASIGKWRRGLILLGSSFASGFALLLVALIPSYMAAAIIMVLLGLGDAGQRTLNHVLIMEEVEDRFRGRVMSVFMMNFGLMPLGVLPAGAVAQAYGGQVAVGILAALLLVATTVLIATQKRLRQIS